MVNVRQGHEPETYSSVQAAASVVHFTFKHLSTYAVLCVDDHRRNMNYSIVFCNLTKQVGR